MLVDETFRAHVETGHETGKEYRDGIHQVQGLQPYLFNPVIFYTPVLWDKTSHFSQHFGWILEVPSG